MKTKLLLGFSVVAMGAAFWACGTGSIEDLSAGDENARDLYGLDPDALDQLVAEAKKNCADDESCVAAQEKAEPIKIESSESEEEPESSAEGDSAGSDQKSSASTPKSSATPASSGATPASSASVAGSSTSTATSSAAIIVPTSSAAAAGSATCKASLDAIDAGKSITWSFGKVLGATINSYSWTFEGGSPSVTASTEQSPVVKYTGAAGPIKATVTLQTSAGTKTAECYSKINGKPITGCKCSPDKTLLDVAELGGSATVKWTASGCASSDGTTAFTYAWAGGTAGSSNTYSKSFTDRTKDYAPSLKIAKSDRDTTVACGTVNIMNGPEYVVEEINGKMPVPAGSNPVTIKVSYGTFYCENGGSSMSGWSVICGDETITSCNNCNEWYFALSCKESVVTVNLPSAGKCGVY